MSTVIDCLKAITKLLTFIFLTTSLTMTSNMALTSGASGTTKLIAVLLSPSWSSGILTVLITLLVVGGTILLAHIGGATQQSLLGLHTVYRHSSIGTSTNTVGKHLSSNTIFNNGILFVLWGSVGLVVYSVVQGMANELKNTDDLLRELKYVHIDRHKVVFEAVLRGVIRFAALAAWWILAWLMLHKIFPYAIATAHISAYNLANTQDWFRTVLSLVYCLLSIHALIVLVRLIVLRPRLTGNSIIDT
jgi:hypothetical protein